MFNKFVWGIGQKKGTGKEVDSPKWKVGKNFVDGGSISFEGSLHT